MLHILTNYLPANSALVTDTQIQIPNNVLCKATIHLHACLAGVNPRYVYVTMSRETRCCESSTHPHLRRIHNCLVHTRHDAVPGPSGNDTGQQGIQLTAIQCLGVDLDVLKVFTQNCHPQFAVR